jgi:phosphohistidine phosphatase SixA
MKKLILVRHGQYDKTGHLNDAGREQINKLAGELKQLIDKNLSILVLTSPTDRTRGSAEIIANFFGVKLEEEKAFLSNGLLHPMNLSKALEVVKSKDKYDVIIIVTHFDYVADFPGYFSERELGVKLSSIEIGKGEAWVVDCVKKTLTLVDGI